MSRIWVPDTEAPVRHSMIFSLYKKPISWKRAMPKLSSGGKPYMIKDQGDREHQREILRAFTSKATKLGLLDIFPWSGPVMLHIFSYFSQPKNYYVGKERDGAPDVDNLAKQVLDALQPPGAGGWGAYHNDAQVIDLFSSKRYSSRGDIIAVQLILLEKVVKPLKRRKQ